MKYPGVKLRAKGDQVLTMPAGTSVAASAHAGEDQAFIDAASDWE